MTVKLLTEHHLEFLSLQGGCTVSSESTLVKIPHCWKSHVAAHIYSWQCNRTILLASRDTGNTETVVGRVEIIGFKIIWKISVSDLLFFMIKLIWSKFSFFLACYYLNILDGI